MVVHVPYTDYFVVHANVWRANVGRITLYLLDTDNEMNSEYDRSITHHLYGGNWEDRLKQEILLGIGGMMLLRQLRLNKDIYHCNEGHAALLNLYRLSEYTEQGMSLHKQWNWFVLHRFIQYIRLSVLDMIISMKIFSKIYGTICNPFRNQLGNSNGIGTL